MVAELIFKYVYVHTYVLTTFVDYRHVGSTDATIILWNVCYQSAVYTNLQTRSSNTYWKNYLGFNDDVMKLMLVSLRH